MASRKPRKRKRPPLMGSHNRCWLWGQHLVQETLAAGRWPIVELRLGEELPQPQRDRVTAIAGERAIPVTLEPSARLTQLCGAPDHQGYLAKMRPFPFVSLEDLLGRLSDNPLVCLLDGIQDPHNFGAIIRAAEVLGADGIIVLRTRQSEVTAAVARASAGAVNHLPLAQVDDLAATARQLREQHGLRIVAADQHAERMSFQQDWTEPTALVIGNESAGVSQSLREECDGLVRIPQTGQIESLNAAVAAGILFYEVSRQRLAANGG